MADPVDTAQTLNVLLSGEARPAERGIRLGFATEGGEQLALTFPAKVVPATISALASLLGQVVSDLPEEEQPNFQVLKTTGMGLAMNPEGRFALILTLEGGGELTLALAPADLHALRDQIDEAISIADDPRH